MDVVPEEIEEFASAHTTPLPALLEELIAETEREFGERAGMLSGVLVGTLLQTLIAASGARRVLEIGMFTGFSAQMMAAALPADGLIITCDVDPKAIGIARRYFERGRTAARSSCVKVRRSKRCGRWSRASTSSSSTRTKGTTSTTTRQRCRFWRQAA